MDFLTRFDNSTLESMGEPTISNQTINQIVSAEHIPCRAIGVLIRELLGWKKLEQPPEGTHGIKWSGFCKLYPPPNNFRRSQSQSTKSRLVCYPQLWDRRVIELRVCDVTAFTRINQLVLVNSLVQLTCPNDNRQTTPPWREVLLSLSLQVRKSASFHRRRILVKTLLTVRRERVHGENSKFHFHQTHPFQVDFSRESNLGMRPCPYKKYRVNSIVRELKIRPTRHRGNAL